MPATRKRELPEGCRLLRPSQAIDRLNVGKSKFYEWVRKGLIKPFRQDGVTRFPVEEIDRFISSRLTTEATTVKVTE